MSPGPQGTSLGVDFGTSHTIAVVRRADGSLRPLLFDGAPLMPSAVCADAEGGLLVGRDAVHAGRRHPERFEPNPKRLIDRSTTLLGAREYPVPDLVAAVLRAVADECRRVVGHPSQVTLTVPAEWGPARRQVVEDAAARSGLGRVRLVPEPVAAATYYAEALKHRMEVGASIVVYDLGAGTFDASVVRRTEDGFATVALDGRSDLGGLDIDAALVEHLGGTYGDREGWKRLMNPTTIEERRHLRDFQEEIRGAKERLSRHQQADFAIPLLDVDAHLTRTELEGIARPHLDQTIRVTQAVIRAAGLDVAASAGVFLVGGASRMPLVATLLHRSLGVAPTVLDQPEIVVAEGSVLWQAASGAAALTPPGQPGGLAAPLTPASDAADRDAVLTPQASAAPAPLTEPPTQTFAYRPSPPEPVTAQAPAVRPDASPTGNLPPQAYRPAPSPPSAAPPYRTGEHYQAGQSHQQTPPRPQRPGSDDPEAPAAPLTEDERRRRRRIGNRAVVAIILVNVLVIALLAWYFGRERDSADGSADVLGSDAPSFDPAWEAAAAGDLVGEITGAHEGRIVSLTTLDTADGQMLFSAGPDGTVRQWSLDSGELVDEYRIEPAVTALWPSTSSTGEPIVVALDPAHMPYVWSAETGEFASAGTFDLAFDGFMRVLVGRMSDQPVLAFVNGTHLQVYHLEEQYSDGAVRLPAGIGWPNLYAGAASGTVQALAVAPDHTLDFIDVYSGEAYASIEDDGDWAASESADGLGIVYDEGVPHAMLYTGHATDQQYLHFWDLETGSQAYPAIPYGDLGDRFHNEIVATGTGPALMYTDESGNAVVYGIESMEETALENDDTGAVTEVEELVLADGREFAVTGDENGSIQFWSLGL